MTAGLLADEICNRLTVAVYAGLDLTGVIGIYWQLISLLGAVAPSIWDLYVSHLGSAIVTYSLVLGLAVSRFGLWTFDLAVAQMLQTRVPEEELGELV